MFCISSLRPCYLRSKITKQRGKPHNSISTSRTLASRTFNKATRLMSLYFELPPQDQMPKHQEQNTYTTFKPAKVTQHSPPPVIQTTTTMSTFARTARVTRNSSANTANNITPIYRNSVKDKKPEPCVVSSSSDTASGTSSKSTSGALTPQEGVKGQTAIVKDGSVKQPEKVWWNGSRSPCCGAIRGKTECRCVVMVEMRKSEDTRLDYSDGDASLDTKAS
jgi:hypothetical protein